MSNETDKQLKRIADFFDMVKSLYILAFIIGASFIIIGLVVAKIVFF